MKWSKLNSTQFDVIVCGAGSAGIAAACSAAKAGAKTLILEKHAFSGGTVTAAMIHTLDAIKNCSDHQEEIVKGFASELIEEVNKLGGVVSKDNPGEALTIHPEVYKISIDQILDERGVKTLYHAHVFDVIREGRKVTGVVVALKDGRANIYGDVVIDCTGDAEIAFYAGGEYDLDAHLQALTCHFRLGNIPKGIGWEAWEQKLQAALNSEYEEGKIDVYGGPWVIRLNDFEISINGTRVFCNPIDPLELSMAEKKGRLQVYKIWKIIKRRVPELEQSYIIACGSQLHIRESRKIVGEYTLNEENTKDGSAFFDGIAIGTWPVDIHPTDGFVGVHPHKDDPSPLYEIPYRCLVPISLDGLLVAGRPISTTHKAHGSTRVPGTSMATGQAAGVAAAMASRLGVEPRAIDVVELQKNLRLQGAIVSNKDCL